MQRTRFIEPASASKEARIFDYVICFSRRVQTTGQVSLVGISSKTKTVHTNSGDMTTLA